MCTYRIHSAHPNPGAFTLLCPLLSCVTGPGVRRCWYSCESQFVRVCVSSLGYLWKRLNFLMSCFYELLMCIHHSPYAPQNLLSPPPTPPKHSCIYFTPVSYILLPILILSILHGLVSLIQVLYVIFMWFSILFFFPPSTKHVFLDLFF